MKIVINTEHSGFGLSETAQRRYLELIGKNPDDWCNYTWSNIDRTDKVLVQVVEELGDEANDLFSHLEVEEIEAGTHYRILNYDGVETVECRYLIDGWNLALDD
jgi:flavin-dependent dehydrogenase